MNYLAHAYLAGALPADRVGGVMGDFVKGVLPAGLPPDLAAGVRLHRQIDVFADTHSAFIRSRQRVSPERRRFAGVMVDMFYDHFLARNWDEFGAGPLEASAADTYHAMEARTSVFPLRLIELFPRMRATDWLSSYRSADAIALALDRMSGRLRRENVLRGGGVELLHAYGEFESDFFEFIKDAQDFADDCRRRRDLIVPRSSRA